MWASVNLEENHSIQKKIFFYLIESIFGSLVLFWEQHSAVQAWIKTHTVKSIGSSLGSDTLCCHFASVPHHSGFKSNKQCVIEVQTFLYIVHHFQRLKQLDDRLRSGFMGSCFHGNVSFRHPLIATNVYPVIKNILILTITLVCPISFVHLKMQHNLWKCLQ